MVHHHVLTMTHSQSAQLHVNFEFYIIRPVMT